MASSKSRRNRDQTAAQGADTPPALAPGGGGVAGKRPPRPGQCRNFTRKAVAESLPAIVDTFLEEARKGSVSHMNQLAKFGGFDHRPIPEPVKRRHKSRIQELVENMAEHEAKMIAARDAKLAAEREPSR